MRTSSGNGNQGSKWCRKDLRLALYIRDRFTCAYCGRDLRGADACEVTLDHLVARHHGGTNEPTNLVTACRSCNSSRQDRPWMDYATGGAIDRIETLRHTPLNRSLAKAIISGEIDATVADVEALR